MNSERQAFEFGPRGGEPERLAYLEPWTHDGVEYVVATTCLEGGPVEAWVGRVYIRARVREAGDVPAGAVRDAVLDSGLIAEATAVAMGPLRAAEYAKGNLARAVERIRRVAEVA